jgi:LPXTG-site transpeptidase (sortase) family protein
MKKLSPTWQLLLFYVVVAGVVGFALFERHTNTLALQHASAAAASAVQSAQKSTVVISGKPVRVLIPSAGIDLPIVDGTYDSDKKLWSVSYVAANYATNTPLINNSKDRTIIYGHALKNIFGNLQNVKEGDKAYIYTDNGHIFGYTYASTQIVLPNNTDVFNQLTGPAGVYLMTCDGLWSSERRIVLFNLESAK